MSPAKWRPFYLGLNVLSYYTPRYAVYFKVGLAKLFVTSFLQYAIDGDVPLFVCMFFIVRFVFS